MPSTRSTRSSVLGKRAHQHQEESATPNSSCEQQLQTPESTPNPKRVKICTGAVDGDSNKENIPPLKVEVVNAEPATPRSTRALRRSATETMTPARSRSSIARHSSTSSVNGVPATPIEGVSRMTISTPPPTPPLFLQPLHVRAKALLRSFCNHDNFELAGRDSERNAINDFLTSFLDDSAMMDDTAVTGLYISGSPGTGKTALVNSVLRKLNSDVKVFSFNCMALKSVDSLWERLLEDLEAGKKKSTGRTKKAKGREGVEATLAGHVGKCVVILDELDHITPNTQVLTSLFSLSAANPSKLRLIGIANTHTLTSSSASTSSISAVNSVQTLHFAPYTSGQLLEILQTRLSPIYEPTPEGEPNVAAKKFLPAPALTLLSKKVASLTGDVRSLFEVLRGAIDIALTSMTTSPAKDENPMATPSPTVAPPHILAALKAHTSSSSKPAASKPAAAAAAPSRSHSEIVSKITNLGMQARLVLLSAILAARRLDAGMQLTSSSASPKKPTSPMKRSNSTPTTANSSAGIDPTQLHTYYSAILGRCDRGASEPVSRSEFGDLIGMLEGNGLFSGGLDAPGGKGGRGTFGRTASFGGGSGFGAKGKAKAELRLAEGVRSDEVLRALGVTSSNDSPNAVQEEVMKAIWEAEKARLVRELKALDREKAKALAAAQGLFDGAIEDD